MTRLLATHDAFLQSAAQLFILPLSSDGRVSHPTLTRALTLYPSNAALYRSKAVAGSLALGDVLLHKIQQTTGLGATSNHSVSHIASLIVTTHAYHSPAVSTLIHACQVLQPELYRLMRYQGLRHAAFLASPLIRDHEAPDSHDTTLSPLALWQLLTEHLDVPRLRLTVHFNQQTDLSQLYAAATT